MNESSVQSRLGGAHRRRLKWGCSGAYWSGPIGELEVVVLEPEGRVAHARFEGLPAQRRSHGSCSRQLNEVEPDWPPEIALIAAR